MTFLLDRFLNVLSDVQFYVVVVMCKTENLPDHGSGDTALGGQKLKVLTITSFKRLKS